MMFAFGMKELEVLAIPIGIILVIIAFRFIPAFRDSAKEGYEHGQSIKAQNPKYFKVMDLVFGILLIVGFCVWLFFFRK